MKRLAAVLFPACVAAVLIAGVGQARADMCLGGPSRGEPPDYAAPADNPGPGDATDAVDGDAPDVPPGEVAARRGVLPRHVGAYLLIAASLSTGWLVFRRREP